MTLGQVLLHLDGLSDGATILAEPPWTADSRATVREFTTDTLVAAMTEDGQTYFLEVAVAREVREGLVSAGQRDEGALCDRIIRYAIDDA